jgi:hypothetical protein
VEFDMIYFKGSYLCVVVVLLLLIASNAFSHCLTSHEKTELWKAMFQDLEQNKKVLYDTLPRVVPEFTGFVSSNERHHYTLAESFADGIADVHVGFGTLINFNILAHRKGEVVQTLCDKSNFTLVEKVRTALFVDQSPEVVVAMKSFWRPLWLASRDPVEWLANLGNFEIDSETTVSTLFEKIQVRRNFAQDPPTEAGITRFGDRLQQLASEGSISELDRQFAFTILYQEYLGCPSIFSNATLSTNFAENIETLYNPKNETAAFENAFEEVRKVAREKLTQFKGAENLGVISGLDVEKMKSKIHEGFQYSSFLLDSEGYQRVRNIFLSGRDFYAVSKLENPYFWEVVSQVAREYSHSVTDVYLTCIPQHVRREKLFQGSLFDEFLKKCLSKVPGDKKLIYESTCGAETPVIQVTTWEKSDGDNERVLLKESL